VSTLLAAGLTNSSSQYLSIASNSSVQVSGVDAWFAGWVYLQSKVAFTGHYLFCKSDLSSSGEYILRRDYQTDRYEFYIQNGGTFRGVSASTFGSPPTGAWTFVYGDYDSVSGTVNISINGAASQSASTFGTVPTGTSQELDIGAISGGFNAFDGRIDSPCFGKSPVGGIAGLRSAIIASLYNAGAGKTYAKLTAAEKTNWGLVSYWLMNEATGATRVDSHGSNNLTDHNSVAQVVGVVDDDYVVPTLTGPWSNVAYIDVQTEPHYIDAGTDGRYIDVQTESRYIDA
jgi:hypothetical protein